MASMDEPSPEDDRSHHDGRYNKGKERPILRRLTWAIAGTGAILSGLAFVVSGGAFAVAVAAGAAVAVGNWMAIVAVLERALGAPVAVVMGLLFLKMAALFAVCVVLVAVLRIDVWGFALGLSSFVVGLVVGGLSRPVSSDPADDSDRNHDGTSSHSGFMRTRGGYA